MGVLWISWFGWWGLTEGAYFVWIVSTDFIRQCFMCIGVLEWDLFPVIVIPWQLLLDVIERVLGMSLGNPASAPVARRFCIVMGGSRLLLLS